MMDNEFSQQGGTAGREAQFAVERVYRMPFRERRVFDEQTGRPRYVPLETEPVATGVEVLDEWLRWLGAGAEGGVEVFCKAGGVRREDWDGLVRVLSGVSCQEFMTLYALRLARTLFVDPRRPFDRSAFRPTRACRPSRCQPSCRSPYRCRATDAALLRPDDRKRLLDA